MTQGQFEQVLGKNPSSFCPSGISKDVIAGMDTSSFPVERVSWDEATKFCSKLDEVEKLTGRTGYHLPTEAQWEFACRAGTTNDFWIGEDCDGVSMCFVQMHQQQILKMWQLRAINRF